MTTDDGSEALAPRPPRRVARFTAGYPDKNCNDHVACGAGVFFERAISPWKRHVEVTRLLSPIFHCHKIKDGGYNNITISPTQNTPALQANNHGTQSTIIEE